MKIPKPDTPVNIVKNQISDPSLPHLKAATEISRVSLDKETVNTSGIAHSVSIADSKKKKPMDILNESDISSPSYSESSSK
jgi:hypothetical protein